MLARPESAEVSVRSDREFRASAKTNRRFLGIIVVATGSTGRSSLRMIARAKFHPSTDLGYGVKGSARQRNIKKTRGLGLINRAEKQYCFGVAIFPEKQPWEGC
jgi:hypothetical protein